MKPSGLSLSMIFRGFVIRHAKLAIYLRLAISAGKNLLNFLIVRIFQKPS